MSEILTIEKEIEVFDFKAKYMDTVAKDAAEMGYWALAKSARQEAAVARATLRGLYMAKNNAANTDISKD